MKVDQPGAPVTVSWSWWERALVWGGFVGLGAGAGWLLPRLVHWLRDLPVGPFGWVDEQLDALPGWTVTPVAIAVGAVLGAVVAGIGEYEALRVRLTREDVELRRKDERVLLGRTEVAHVFLDGKELVAIGPDGRERTRQVSDADKARLAAAFEATGWPWRAADPFAAEFRRWVPGMPGMPDGAAPLMVARQRALDRDDAEEASMLRAELNAVGVLVRDEKDRQHWRPAHP